MIFAHFTFLLTTTWVSPRKDPSSHNVNVCTIGSEIGLFLSLRYGCQDPLDI